MNHTVFVGRGKHHCIYHVLCHHACQNIHEKLNLMNLGTFNFFFPSMTLCWHYSFTDKVSNIVRIYMLTFCYRYSVTTFPFSLTPTRDQTDPRIPIDC